MDGNYGKTIALRLRSADTAIILDFPGPLCLWRAVKRSILGFGRARPDMADGCHEKLDPAFFRFIWRFRSDHRPKLLAESDRFTAEKILLRSSRDIERLLSSLRSTFVAMR
jgi:adenylate kinase family enzyme